MLSVSAVPAANTTPPPTTCVPFGQATSNSATPRLVDCGGSWTGRLACLILTLALPSRPLTLSLFFRQSALAVVVTGVLPAVSLSWRTCQPFPEGPLSNSSATSALLSGVPGGYVAPPPVTVVPFGHAT